MSALALSAFSGRAAPSVAPSVARRTAAPAARARALLAAPLFRNDPHTDAVGATPAAAMSARPLTPTPVHTHSSTTTRLLAPPPHAADPAATASKWWEAHPENTPNLRAVDGLDGLLGELRAAGDSLVVVDVYGQWCGACRAVFPKFTRLASEHPDVVFLSMDFDANKAVAKAMGVRALPAFICFRGADGKLENFTAGPSRAGALAAAIERHNSPRCQLGEARGSTPELDALAAERRAAAEAALAGAAGAAGVA